MQSTLLLLVALVASQHPESIAATVFSSASRSIVVVEALDAAGAKTAIGSGVVVAREVVVTNCHVLHLREGRNWRVSQRTSHFIPSLLSEDSEHDLCELKVPGLSAPAAEVRLKDSLQIGDAVYAIGSPQGLELSISEGIVSSLREVEGAFLIQTSASISPGSSGGGLFDQDGRLVGITTFSIKGGQNLNFALPAAWLPTRMSPQPTEPTPNQTPRTIAPVPLPAGGPKINVPAQLPAWPTPNRTRSSTWSTDGWLAFRWGMGVADVNERLRDTSSKSTLKARSELLCESSRHQLVCSLAADQHELSLVGASPSLTFGFTGGRLWYVFLSFEPVRDVAIGKKRFDEISFLLVHKYGPIDDTLGSDDRVPTVKMTNHYWYRKQLQLELSITEIAKNSDEDGAIIDLRYVDPAANDKLTRETRDKQSEKL